jgi:Arc/MetJ-type ribon-helix-helix transcriptional regulator
MAPTRPISVRLTHDLLARIDAAVAAGRAKHRNAFITQACERRLLADSVHDKVLAGLRGVDHAREDCTYPLGCTGCVPDQVVQRADDLQMPEPETVQERAARGEPDAVARMAVAAELPAEHVAAVEADLRGRVASFDPDADGDIAGADYPPQP